MSSRNWFFTLLLLGVSSSLVNFCTVPLAGFAAIAVLTLTQRQGLICLTVIWAVNQALGFGFRGYPLDISTVAWGIVMLGGVLLALLLGHAIHRGVNRRSLVRPARLATLVATSLMTCFLVYELILWLASFQLGTDGGFTPSVLGSVLFTNSLWAMALSILYRVGERTKWLSQSHRHFIPLR